MITNTLEQLALKRDQALMAYTAVLKANRLTGHIDMGQLVSASNASTSAHNAWSNAYDESVRTNLEEDQEECSACCGAEILDEDICSECKEHCDIFTEDEAMAVYLDSGFDNGLTGEA